MQLLSGLATLTNLSVGLLLRDMVEGRALNLSSCTISLVDPKGLTRTKYIPTSGHRMPKYDLRLRVEPYRIVKKLGILRVVLQ
jgi:hypothetical protein